MTLGHEAMRTIAFAALVLIAGCARAPSISEAESAAVETEAASLLSKTDARDISSANWPEQIRNLNPIAVRIRSDGLYVVTSSWFVEEAGLFVPRHPDALSPVVGSDPEYRRLYGRVFSYRTRG